MKKNFMMRAASVLLVAVMLTTCAISGTFAKYVTSGDSNDSARVAIWGVSVTANYSDLFTETYKSDNGVGEDPALTVESIYGGDLVAPGTNGSLADFEVSGAPEVDVEVTYDATLTLGDNWMIDTDDDDTADTEYCPIIITVNSKDYYIGGTDLAGGDIDDVDALEAAIKVAIEASTEKYDAGSNLAEVANDLEVSWRWEFETNTLVDYQDDVKDTALGDAAVAAAATIALSIECTITQID